jgi:O-acetyl-ADP-ribose deacetylase
MSLLRLTIGRGEPARTITVAEGDITCQPVDAIVNAANSSLLGGGGVDGAIHRAGGPAILDECKELRRTQYPKGLPAGEAVATTGGQLQAKYVIHTVGPVWRGGTHGEPEQLADAYRESIRVADELGLHSIAFPAVSTGAYGYPLDRATETAVKTVAERLRETKHVHDVRLVAFDTATLRVYATEMERLSCLSEDYRLDRFTAQ